jgi:hypothetical protein
MISQELEKSEIVVRAILETNYDATKKRYSSSLFTGGNTSVSRLAILSYSDIVDIFLIELDKPERAVIGSGSISVQELQEIGSISNNKLVITVVSKPTEANPSHAEIPQKIPRGTALEIIKKLKIQEISKWRRWRRIIGQWLKALISINK